MAISDKGNSRRAHEAETARQIASAETAAFFTTLLAVLNEAEATSRLEPHLQHERPAPEPVPPSAAPEPMSNETAPADAHHEGRHPDSSEAQPPETATTVHAAAEPAHEPHQVATEASLLTEPSATHVALSSPLLSGLDTAADRTLSHDASGSHGITSAPSSAETVASVPATTDPVASVVDGLQATVSHAISDVTGTLGQLTASLTSAINHVTSAVTGTIDQVTSTLTGTINHLTDGVTGLVSNLVHDSSVTAVVQPLVTDILGPPSDTAQHAPDHAQPMIPLLDTAGAVPTALLHPLPLQLGFLGQPTMDGHDTHDGAFSALGVHHF